MKRTRAQQPKVEDTQDAGTAASAGNPAKPLRRAKQPRQPKAGAAKKPSAATARAAAVATAAVKASCRTESDEAASSIAAWSWPAAVVARLVGCCMDTDVGVNARGPPTRWSIER